MASIGNNLSQGQQILHFVTNANNSNAPQFPDVTLGTSGPTSNPHVTFGFELDSNGSPLAPDESSKNLNCVDEEGTGDRMSALEAKYRMSTLNPNAPEFIPRSHIQTTTTQYQAPPPPPPPINGANEGDNNGGGYSSASGSSSNEAINYNMGMRHHEANYEGEMYYYVDNPPPLISPPHLQQPPLHHQQQHGGQSVYYSPPPPPPPHCMAPPYPLPPHFTQGIGQSGPAPYSPQEPQLHGPYFNSGGEVPYYTHSPPQTHQHMSSQHMSQQHQQHQHQQRTMHHQNPHPQHITQQQQHMQPIVIPPQNYQCEDGARGDQQE